MKPRDRVIAALAHEPPDRGPMQISFTPEFAARLRKDMGLAESDLHNPHGGLAVSDAKIASQYLPLCAQWPPRIEPFGQLLKTPRKQKHWSGCPHKQTNGRIGIPIKS